MADEHIFTHLGGEDALDSYQSFRIDDNGIKRDGYRLLPWQHVQRVRAWVTAGDGNWGFDEVFGLELTHTDGYRLRVTDARGTTELTLLYKLQYCIRLFLPAIAPDWQQRVRADYQRHYRRPQWLGAIS